MRGREGCQQFIAQRGGARGVQFQIDRAVVSEFLMRCHRCIDLGQRVLVLIDSDARVTLFLHPRHRLQGHHFHFALHARDIPEDGRKRRQQLLLLFLQLFIRFVYREVKIRGECGVAPGFADLVMIAERVVIPREQQHQNGGKNHKRAKAQDGIYQFVIFHIFIFSF